MAKRKHARADMAAATEALGDMGTGQVPPSAGMAAVDVYADWTVLSRLAERAADSLDEAAASLVAYLHESGDLTESRVVLMLGGVQQMAKRARKLSRTAQTPRTGPGSTPSVPKGLTSTHTSTQPEKRASGPEKGTSGE